MEETTSNVRMQTSDLMKRINELEHELEFQGERSQDMNTVSELLNARIKELEAGLEGGRQRRTDTSKLIADLQSQLSTYEKQAEDVGEQVQLSHQKCTEAKDRIKAAEDDLKEKVDAMAKMGATLESLKQRDIFKDPEQN